MSLPVEDLKELSSEVKPEELKPRKKFWTTLMVFYFTFIAMSLIFAFGLNSQFEYMNNQVLDLNSSLNDLKSLAIIDHNFQIQGSLANLIVQGASLNSTPDENDAFVMAWRTQCQAEWQDFNAKKIYYGCKTE